MTALTYGSVCSGIEAASAAWHPLGWRASFLSEIEAFPRSVLAHHYPETPLHGDFTTIKAGEYEPIDLLVGGTPCQSFSVAGLRGGLDDDRGNLALEYLRLADRLRPRWLVWENVPGVLSSNGGRDFGAILGGMVELGYGVAYRVLDAQFFGVAQRRRRVFVVGYLGDWRRAAAVLFERHSLSGNPAPRREARKDLAPTISARPSGGGGLGTDFDLDGGCVVTAPTLRAGGNRTGGDRPYGTDVDTCDSLVIADPIVIMERGRDGSPNLEYRSDGTANAILTPNGGRGGLGVGAVAYAIQERAVCENPSAGPDGAGFRADDAAYTLEARTVPQAIAFDTTQITGAGNYSNPTAGDPCHPLASGAHPPAIVGSAVRRLTPRECERLQGFPDDYTLTPHRGKPAADGPRYKSLGNSMAVPVMRWIGERIAAVEAIQALERAA
jgi:DNA (cytosine-5)-methyltransferase 1